MIVDLPHLRQVLARGLYRPGDWGDEHRETFGFVSALTYRRNPMDCTSEAGWPDWLVELAMALDDRRLSDDELLGLAEAIRMADQRRATPERIRRDLRLRVVLPTALAFIGEGDSAWQEAGRTAAFRSKACDGAIVTIHDAVMATASDTVGIGATAVLAAIEGKESAGVDDLLYAAAHRGVLDKTKEKVLTTLILLLTGGAAPTPQPALKPIKDRMPAIVTLMERNERNRAELVTLIEGIHPDLIMGARDGMHEARNALESTIAAGRALAALHDVAFSQIEASVDAESPEENRAVLARQAAIMVDQEAVRLALAGKPSFVHAKPLNAPRYEVGSDLVEEVVR